MNFISLNFIFFCLIYRCRPIKPTSPSKTIKSLEGHFSSKSKKKAAWAMNKKRVLSSRRLQTMNKKSNRTKIRNTKDKTKNKSLSNKKGERSKSLRKRRKRIFGTKLGGKISKNTNSLNKSSTSIFFKHLPKIRDTKFTHNDHTTVTH